ncbi:hypothetical protein LDO31_14585 [Luteimonas sp. XNQY3]|nr:hypothetical protein [Luteimonas sp. XNQY3]MCD9007444.1 hypothetical protein [Luteimonas sp. XNQY3]
MSKFETEDRGALGYFLPEDGQFRLRKLHQHIEFLSRLAEPRVDEEEDGPEIDHPALAGCLELLAEQVQQVLDTVSWPARLQAKGKLDAAGDEVGQVEQAAEVASDDASEIVQAETGGSEETVDDDYEFGMTMDQLDEMNRLLDQLTAQGDLLMAGAGGDFAKGTLIVTGASIFNDADAAHTIIRQVNSQHLDDSPAAGLRVRETPSLYDVPPVAAARPQGDHRAGLH